jgi:hypothetical protein
LERTEALPAARSGLVCFRGEAGRFAACSAAARAGEAKQQAAAVAKLEMPQAALLHAQVAGVEVDSLVAVAADPHVGHAGHVLQQPPVGLPFVDAALKLAQHFSAVVGRGKRTAGAGEVLAGGTTDDAVEAARWEVEVANVAAKNQVRSAHHTIALALEPSTE